MSARQAIFACAATVLISTAAAQEPSPAALSFDRVPLHTSPADPTGGSYGLWAAGQGYKASFHDGFCFYPYRGPDRPRVALRWRTESVRCGEEELAGGMPTAHTGQWRHELRYGLVSEVYDVLVGGVEQSFVLHGAPADGGDVVVRGRISTELQATACDAALQRLTFSDDGRPVVSYGEALAFDAAGRRIGVTTEFDGECIRLRLAGSFLEGAAYPVTIDPLTSAVQVTTTLTGGPVERTAVATGGKALVVLSRRFASGDTDAYAFVCDGDFRNAVMIWSDLNTWTTKEVDVCYVPSASRFVIAFQRDYTALNSQVLLYLHDHGSTAFNSGIQRAPTAPLGRRRQNPQVGGQLGGPPGPFTSFDDALLVCEEDPIGPNNVGGTRITSITMDASTATLGTAHTLGGTSSVFDRARPSVCPLTNFEGSAFATIPIRWIVVWSLFDSNANSYVIRMARVGPSGSQLATELLRGSSDQLITPKVAGSWEVPSMEGRFAACWIRRQSGFVSGSVEVLRFDVDGSNPITRLGVKTVVRSSAGFLNNLDLAHDWRTRSHWAVTYSADSVRQTSIAYVARLGGTGGVVETQSLHPVSSDRPGELAVAYYIPATGTQRFLVSYGLEDTLQRVVGRQFLYPSGAGTSSYGAGCNGGTLHVVGPPFAGNSRFGFNVGPNLQGFKVLVIGFAPTNGIPTPLPGCQLWVDPLITMTTFIAFGVVVPEFPVPLPDDPVVTGDFFVQGAYLGANPSATAGLRVQVR